MPLRSICAACLAAALLAAPAASADPGGGITADEAERQTPPPPRDVEARLRADGVVEISWLAPAPPPPGPLMYERRFAHYRIYRITKGEQAIVGETGGLTALDRAPRQGGTYVVVTVQRDGREGARPDAVAPWPNL